MHKRILVATDFTEASKNAVAYAADLAARNSAELHVLFVAVLHGEDPGLIAGMGGVQSVRSNAAAQAAMKKLDFPPDLKVVRLVERGVSAPPTIVEYAVDNRIDLIVMGTHSRTGLARWFIGSVARKS